MLILPLPSALQTSRLAETITDLRDRLTVTSQEAVTGRHSDLTKHLNGRIGVALLGRQAVEDIASQRTRLSLRETRLDIVQESLTRIQDGAVGLDARMHTALGADDTVAQLAVARDAKTALQDAFSTLNTRHAERFLFSGDATATLPFASVEDLLSDIEQIANTATSAADFTLAIDTYFDSPTGGWQQNIYQGTPTTTNAEGITGTDPGLKELLKGLATIAAVGPTTNVPSRAENKLILQTAARTVSTGQTALTTLRADRGVDQARIGREQETLNLEETVLSEAFNQLTARDQYEASSELNQLETALETSYLLTSRLNNLSLVNYLS